MAKKFISILLLFCVLFSTHQFTVYEHTCLITGIKKTSLTEISKLCSPSAKPFKTPTINKASCCKLFVKEFKSKPIGISDNNLKIEKANLDLTILDFNFIIPEFETYQSSSYFYTSRTSNKSLTYLINQQFLI